MKLEHVVIGIETGFVLCAILFWLWLIIRQKKKKPEVKPLCVKLKEYQLGKTAQRAADNFDALHKIHGLDFTKYCDAMMEQYPSESLYYNNLKLLYYKQL